MANDNGIDETALHSETDSSQAAQPRSKLIEYVDELTEKLRASLTGAIEGNVEAIHDARVATRRLKAMMDLFDAHLTRRLKDRFSKSLKRIRRRLGRIRDLDVMIEHIHEAKRANPEMLRFLTEHLKQERAAELQQLQKLNAAKMLGKLGSWWGLREQIPDELAMSLLKESLRVRLEQFCQHADIHSGAIAEARDSLGEAAALNPHELRIFGKALRYTLEMAVEEGIKIPRPVLRTFKRMQDLLGLWHDYVVLTGKIMQICVDEHVSLTQPELLKKCLTFAQSTARKSDSRLNDFFKLWKKNGSTIRLQIEDALSETEKGGETIAPVETEVEETLST